MSYLIRIRGGKARAHIWLGDDTACRMYSTGGLVPENFHVMEDRGSREVCQMCAHNDSRCGLSAITDFIQPDNSLHGEGDKYAHWRQGDDGITLDGRFTVAELRGFVDHMERFGK